MAWNLGSNFERPLAPTAAEDETIAVDDESPGIASDMVEVSWIVQGLTPQITICLIHYQVTKTECVTNERHDSLPSDEGGRSRLVK